MDVKWYGISIILFTRRKTFRKLNSLCVNGTKWCECCATEILIKSDTNIFDSRCQNGLGISIHDPSAISPVQLNIVAVMNNYYDSSVDIEIFINRWTTNEFRRKFSLFARHFIDCLKASVILLVAGEKCVCLNFWGHGKDKIFQKQLKETNENNFKLRYLQPFGI